MPAGDTRLGQGQPGQVRCKQSIKAHTCIGTWRMSQLTFVGRTFRQRVADDRCGDVNHSKCDMETLSNSKNLQLFNDTEII